MICHNLKKEIGASIFSVILVVITGCIDLGPKYKRPDLPFQIPRSYKNENFIQKLFPEQYKWWHVFHDPAISKVVNEAIRNNLDILAAYHRVKEQVAMVLRYRGERFPSINASFQYQKRKIPYDTSEIGDIGSFMPASAIVTSFDLGLAASFEIDLWKRLAKQEDASRAALLQSMENYRTVMQTIISEAVLKYLQIWTLNRRISLVKEQIKNYEITERLLKRRYDKGLVPLLELKQVQQAKAETEARLPELLAELGRTQQELSVLCGKYPAGDFLEVTTESIKLDPIPPGVPSDLLKHRPDILAAEANLMKLNAEVGIALANRFPRISLTGSYGYSSSELTNLFQPSGELWNLSMGIIQPLFNAGRLKAIQKAAEERYAQAIAAYAKTVLNAFKEVESALLTRRYLLDKKEKLSRLIKKSKETLRIATWRYRAGLVDYFQVLDAQRRLFLARERNILLDLSILSNRVALHRALGGMWTAEEEIRE